MKAVSMFAGGGVGEFYLDKLNINVTVANEKIDRRAEFYKYMYPNTNMVIGDIQDEYVFNKFKNQITKDHKLLIATPPCQGVSTLGANKTEQEMQLDERNYLIFSVLKIIDEFDFDYILIENVSRYLNLKMPYNNELLLLEDLLLKKYGNIYDIHAKIFNVKDYGVAQSRPRSIIRMSKKGLEWELPEKEKIITLEEVIGDLPSLESGEDSGIKNHVAKKHNEREILAMMHTKTGCSAMKNKIYYPKKKDGTPVKGFHNTYKRMKWDEPAPARTMNNGNIGSHNNVHPGRLKEDGTYSDARVLTLRELFIVSSLPADLDIPDFASDYLIRQIIGEGVPPLFMYKFLKGIKS